MTPFDQVPHYLRHTRKFRLAIPSIRLRSLWKECLREYSRLYRELFRDSIFAHVGRERYDIEHPALKLHEDAHHITGLKDGNEVRLELLDGRVLVVWLADDGPVSVEGDSLVGEVAMLSRFE